MIRQLSAKALRGYVWATPPHPGRGVVARLAWRLDPREFVHEVADGIKFHICVGNEDHVAYWTGRYEEHDEVRVFSSLLRPGMNVIDVGANVGLYALSAARRVGGTGRVFAFEPVPHVFDRLQSHIALNSVTNVSAHRAAASDADGRASFFVGRNDSLGSLARPTEGQRTDVETVTLDAFVAAASPGPIGAVKIDAEGAELRVLAGMGGLLRQQPKPILLVEHNHDALVAAGTSAGELFDRIRGHGYAAHAILGGELRAAARPVEPSRTYQEATTNYVFLPE